MGRQERPLDPGGGPLALFARDLRGLRRAAGSPSYQRLAARTHFAASTLAAAAAGQRLPSAAVLAAYVAACQGDVEAWEGRRREVWAALAEPVAGTEPRLRAEASALDPAADASHREASTQRAGREPSPEAAPTEHPSQAASPPQTSVEAPPPQTMPTAPPPHATHAPPSSPTPRHLVLRRAVGIVGAVLLLATTGAASAPRGGVGGRAYETWFSHDADIPARYRPAIVAAGTACAAPQVSPALVAAMLKTESGFDPNLSDPANDEYGIARWTPRVLRYYLPEGQQSRVPRPPLDPEVSIAALGLMLCTLAPQLEGVAGDPVLNLAAAYRTATWVVQKENGVPVRVRPYTDEVRVHLLRYAPEGGACLPYATAESSYPAPCE